MNRKIFRQNLYKGLGRALLYLKKHPAKASKYSDIIYNACIYNTKYDSQSEQSRANYLWEAVQLSQNSVELQEQILNVLNSPKNGCDLYQIYELAKRFSEGGNEKAKEIMKHQFKYDIDYDCFIGAEEIIELDDIEGLIFVADIIGRKMNEDSNYDGEFFLSDFVKEKFGDETVLRLIEENSTNKNVGVFLKYVLSISKEKRHNNRGIEPYYKVKEAIDKDEVRPLYKLLVWGRNAPEKEFKEAAIDFLNISDEKRLISYLYIFRGKPFPLEPTRIIQIARSSNKELSEAAVYALGNLKDERIHDLVISFLKEKPNRFDVIRLLEANYFEDDYKLLENVICRNNNKEDIHSIGLKINNVFKSNPTKNCLKSMESLYEKNYCSVCRESIIHIMLENEIIPDRILNEAKYDCNFDIRQMVNNYERHIG